MREADIIYKTKAADMSSKELAFLLLEGMDQDELDERVAEWRNDHAWLAGLPDKIEGENLQ